VLCWACAPRPKRACSGCGEVVAVKANTAAGPVCTRCYRYPERTCGGCGRLAPIAQRACRTEPDLCHRCRPEPTYCCSVCARSRPAKAMWPIGPVCASCQLHGLRHPSLCAGCRRTRILVGRSPDGRPVCGPCSGSELDYRCHACGTVSDLASADRCARCALTEKVSERLAGPDGTIPRALGPFAEVLIGARRPLSVLRWLYRHPGTVLPALAATAEPITHTTLDTLPQPQRLSHLRSLLVHAGVLPAREERLERITPRLEELLTDRPARHQVLIRPYATWAVLRAARRAAARGRYGRNRAERDRRKIVTALRLLDWLDARHLGLNDLTQAQLDCWLVEHPQPHARAALRAFLAWTAHRGLIAKLKISIPAPRQPHLFLGEHEHLTQLRRCIHDTELPLEVRVAGSLLMLFGTTVTRIVQLSVTDLTRRRNSHFLTLGRTPLLLPSPVARLVDALVTAPITGSAMTTERHFLFAGVVPGRHRTAHALVDRLNRHDIRARPTRNTALVTFAAELPSAVLAELVGMTPQTAVQWARVGNTDWAPTCPRQAPAGQTLLALTRAEQRLR
jgi:hypothetical protein